MAGVRNQVICSLKVSFLNMTMGLLLFWPSCTVNLFRSEQTTLNRPMTEAEISFFGSVCAIGGLLGNPVAGSIVDVIGRKWTAILFTSTHVMSWSLLAFFPYVEVAIVAMLVGGLGMAIGMVVPNFISEICQENIRGTMGTLSIVMYSVGMLLSYLLGGSLSYYSMIYTSMAITVAGIVLLSFLEESPTYLMNKGLDGLAAKSFAFYRNADEDSKEVRVEMEKLKRAFNPTFGDETKSFELKDLKSPEKEKLKFDPETEMQAREKISFWTFLRKSYPTRRAACVTTSLATCVILQGMIVVEVYARPVFEAAVPNLSPTLCTVLLASVTIAMGCVSAYLTDRAGRRPLLIGSSITCFIVGVVLGSQLHFHLAPQWVTALLVYMYTAAYAVGSGPVPFLLLSEVFLPEVKSYMTMFIVQWIWFCDFVVLFIFHPVVAVAGLGPVFYLFAAVSLATTVITYFFLPETKGKPIDELSALFGKD